MIITIIKGTYTHLGSFGDPEVVKQILSSHHLMLDLINEHILLWPKCHGGCFYESIRIDPIIQKRTADGGILYATTAQELRKMIKENPDDYPSTFLFDGSFAAFCFDSKTIRELKSAFNADADPSECRRWNISAVEWKNNIEMALIALGAT